MPVEKAPSNRLCLAFEFDLPKFPNSVSEADLNDALQKVAMATGLAPPASLKGKLVMLEDVKSPTTLPKVHHLPFDPEFHVANGGPYVRYEFLYDKAQSKLFIRIVTSLGDTPEMIVDGVTAARIAFHSMEIMEGNELRESVFPKLPPLHYGFRNKLIFVREIYGTILRVKIASATLWIEKWLQRWGLLSLKKDKDLTIVSSPADLLRFFESKQAWEPASYQLFRPSSSVGFKGFLSLVEQWRQAEGLWGFFYLMNFSPLVSSGVTNRIADMSNVEKRYQGAMVPPGPGPPPFVWEAVETARLSRQIFINNYGRHVHNFSAVPKAYLWDWLEMAAPVRGCGCITINGVFMCWNRGMASSLKRSPLGGGQLRTPVYNDKQNENWFSTMGPWIPQF